MSVTKKETIFPNYSQFIIDLPRLTLILDGKLCKKDSTYVYNYLYDRLDKKQLNFCIYFLTQTSLAKFYISECKKINKSCEHLVDDGKYTVKINTINKTINISKSFRKVFLEDSLMFELDFTDLNILYDLEEDITSYCFDYKFKNNDQEVFVEI